MRSTASRSVIFNLWAQGDLYLGRVCWPVHRLFVAAIALTLICLFVSGCRDRSQKFIPTTAVAQQAIARGLDAWKAGEPAGPVAHTSPLVHVTDTNRKPGQQLQDYKILGEKASSHGRTFVVELQLTSPNETRKTEYIIVGIDPMWVFHRDDYELLMHWDHHMPATFTEPDLVAKP